MDESEAEVEEDEAEEDELEEDELEDDVEEDELEDEEEASEEDAVEEDAEASLVVPSGVVALLAPSDLAPLRLLLLLSALWGVVPLTLPSAPPIDLGGLPRALGSGGAPMGLGTFPPGAGPSPCLPPAFGLWPPS